MSFCSNCGNPIRPEARFCECCGAKISAPAAANPEEILPQAAAKGPIWLNAKPEESPKPMQPFFATGPDAAYHAPAESVPMPAAPVPNVPIWMSQKTDLPEDLDGLTIDDIDPQEKSPIDEVSWLAKRSGPIPPKKGLS